MNYEVKYSELISHFSKTKYVFFLFQRDKLYDIYTFILNVYNIHLNNFNFSLFQVSTQIIMNRKKHSQVIYLYNEQIK